MRLFVAVWPSEEIVARIAALPRPAAPGLRWTTRDQWHVTLRFLGDAELAPVVAALQAATLPPTRPVTAGPAVDRFGPRVLVLPVSGLDPLAAATVAATAGLGSHPPDERPFAGHVTLARVNTSGRRGPNRGPDLRSFAGAPLGGSWEVREVTVVESRLGRAGARYEVRARVPLPPPRE
ncbi:MAG TPA: RNA 2',3'-cyclic phosphodiesterase [Acidimicrobiales bacterium]|nr:RNA 2',3'-cyclic phosphodiesterase [Acidimicrobiales bacterium]